MRRISAMATVLAGALALTACGGDPTKDPAVQERGDAGGGTVTVGSANFTESTILAEVYAQALEDAGVPVQKKLEIGSRETYLPALQDGSIDLVPEYTGTLAAYLDEELTATEPEEVYASLQKNLPKGVVALEYSQAANSDNVVVTRETAQEHHLEKISDLEPLAGQMTLGGPPEWQKRPQGVPGLAKTYGLHFQTFRAMNAGGNVTALALKYGQLDAANIFTTDPAIPANDFVVLEDDKGLFSAQNVVPVVSERAATPKVRKALDAVSAALTVDDLAAMNAAVLDGDSPEEVADRWVEEEL